jgi:hypothetical protein
VNAIALALPEDFRRGSDLFGALARTAEAQRRTEVAMKLGFQTRDAELALVDMLESLAEH